MKALWHRTKYPDRATKQRARIHPVSKSRAARLGVYRRQVAAWRKRQENRTCRYPGCGRQKPDVHHSRGRSGVLLLEEQFWIPLCREHHVWVGDHPFEARQMGLLVQPGQWNTPQ